MTLPAALIPAEPMVTSVGSDGPAVKKGEMALIAGGAVVLRCLIIGLACTLGGLSLEQYAAKGDGASYLAVAAAMAGARDWSGLDEYDRRVFPGFAALIALAHTLGLPLPVAGLGITTLSAGVAAFCAGLLFRDRRISTACGLLIPHYLINSSLVMSEAPLLAFTCAGLALWSRNRCVSAAVLLGMAGLIRPMACFAVVGAVVASLSAGRRRDALVLGTVAAAVVLAGLGVFHVWSGDALHGARVYRDSPRAYGGDLFAWPGQSLLFTPLDRPYAAAYIAQVWCHVVIVFLGIGLLLRDLKAVHEPAVPLSLIWLAGNTLFVLCIGSYWGFEHFPRFTIPAQPALFFAFRRFLPARWPAWLLTAGGLTVYAVVGARNSP